MKQIKDVNLKNGDKKMGEGMICFFVILENWEIKDLIFYVIL